MKKVCPKCGFFKEIERGMIFCKDCRQKIYEEQTSQKLRKDETPKEEISKETSEWSKD